MSIYEPARALWWIDQRISAPAIAAGAYGVYPDVAPTTTPPGKVVVIYNYQAGSDITNASAVRLWNSALYQVKITGPASLFDTIVAVADAVDTALQLQGEEVAGPNSDCYVMRCDREQPLQVPTPAIDGVVQSSLTALWRIHIRSLVG